MNHEPHEPHERSDTGKFNSPEPETMPGKVGFDAIRHGTPLTCPAESAFATAVTVLKVNDAVAAKQMLAFAPADFVA